MDLLETKNSLNRSQQYLLLGRLKNAIMIQKRLAIEVNADFLIEKINFQLESYNYLLEYFQKGVDDPRRKELFEDIRSSLLTVNDLLWQEVVKKYDPYRTYSESFADADLEFDLAKLSQQRHEQFSEFFETPNNLDDSVLEEFFVRVWLHSDLSQEEYVQFQKFLGSDAHWVQKALAISALTLSLFYFFSPRKVFLLLDAISMRQENVWERAFVGLIVILTFFDERLAFYPDLDSRIKTLPEIDGFDTIFKFVIIQLLRSGVETQILQERFEKEILPEMERISPKLADKLDLDSLMSDDSFDEENPDWTELMPDEEEFFNKMSEFSMLQMEGADVLHSAFAKMKNFPFFYKISNWFMPFYADNENIINVFVDSGMDREAAQTFVDVLSKARYMCNSDKYSFCYQMQFLPAFQRKTTIELFKMEAKQANDVMETEEMSDPLGNSRQIIIQYIQDLYRFFKVYPFRGELPDIFGDNLQFHKKQFFKSLSDSYLYFEIGDFYFSRKLYAQALDIYLSIPGYDKDPQLLEKIGFINQKKKDYAAALEFYKKAELFEPDKKWLIKKIAFCSMKIAQYDQALFYYNSLLEQAPDDQKIILNIATCYLNKEDYDQALKFYYKVDYYSPDNPKVLRPIGWINFRLKNLDKAKKYYDKVLDTKPRAADFVVAGHIYWLMGQREKAINYYKQGYSQYADKDRFESIFFEDKAVLMAYGLSEFDIDLLFESAVD